MAQNPQGDGAGGAAVSDDGRACKRCGMHIIFRESEVTGKMIPLQAIKSVYFVGPAEGKASKLELEPDQVFVSHFETCPSANQFSGGASG